jgi:4-aminobutyrate aminotransferase/(S)-3-amino-2-methylpropionate transaminase
MPISACAGRSEVMDAWPSSDGEALHTQTFLGHPPSCAAALASLRALEEEGLIERSAEVGAAALAHLEGRMAGRPGVRAVRGLGLLLAVELDGPERAESLCDRALARGIITLLSGDDGDVLALTPPLTIDRSQLLAAIDVVADCLS